MTSFFGLAGAVRPRVAVLGSTALLAMAWAGAANAQSTTSTTTAAVPVVDEDDVEEIVVTAERREASIQTVPIAVTAISAEAIQSRQITEAKDLQRFLQD